MWSPGTHEITLKSPFPQLSAHRRRTPREYRDVLLEGQPATAQPSQGGGRRKLRGVACQQYPATHSLLPHSSRGEGFCPEPPMKPTEHMNKDAGVYYALSSTASWNGLLVKMASGMYSKAFSDILEKKLRISALGKTCVLHIALGSSISGYEQNFGRITLVTW